MSEYAVCNSRRAGRGRQMRDESNAEYLIRREQQELEAALRASDARVRSLHLTMADAYTSRVNEMKRQKAVA